MAMVECVECGQPISSMAEFCPHCGRPTAKRVSAKKYRLIKGGVAQNGYATFLHIMAVIICIIGIILSVMGSWVSGRYSDTFSWSLFFTSFLTYALSTFVLWSIGTIVQMIQETHDMVAGMNLESSEENPSMAAKPAYQAPRYVPSGRNASSEWRCPNCGTRNSNETRSCVNCGEYK